MFLKSLQLQGFKSFPDKTTIDFNKGITAIVGPNGSGKSNINDAVRWVLGEMSTKLLRGTKMEDVIFDGAGSRKAMGFAEVSLTLDNSDKSLPIEFSEVTITRRYYRSGESEYMINRAPVRLKDVHELLMDTGLGRDGYSIIGQGKIADILSSKGDDRRVIFEEAAGISKYRYRKGESERELMQTEENLLRVRDIIAELEGRILPLEKQAETAKEYLRLRDEKKELEVSLWLGSIDNISANKEKIEASCETAHADLQNAEAMIAAREKEAEDVYLEAQQATVAIDALRSDIAKFNALAAAKENEIALLKSDIEHNKELIARLEAELAEDDEKMRDFDAVLNEKRAQITQFETQAGEKQKELAELNQNSAAVLGEESALGAKISALNAEILQMTERLTDTRIKIGFAESNCTVLSQNFDRLAEEKKAAKADHEALEKELSEKRAELNSLNEEIKSLGNSLSGYELRIGTLKARVDKQEAEKQETENKLNSKRLRLSTLGDMQTHFEGYSDSVKQVMQASARRMLSGICGPISAIVHTDEKYSLAIETALGHHIQHIIVNDENDAKAAVYYLKNNNAGRATFLPISTIRGGKIDDGDMLSSPGYLGIASEMVECESRYRGIVEWILGKVCVVDDLENAVRLARKIGYKYRVVTLDGQVVNAGGSMTGGSAGKGSGLIGRQNEMERLRTEIAEQEKAFASFCAALQELSDKLAHDNAYADGVRAEIRDKEDTVTALSLRVEDIRLRAANAKALLNQLEQRDGTAQSEYDAAVAEMKKQTALAETLEKEIAERTAASDELLRGREDIAAKRDALAGKISDIKLEIFTLEKDKETMIRSIDELNGYRNERGGLIESKKAEIADLTQKNAGIEENIRACAKQTEEFRAQGEQISGQINELRLKRDGSEKKAADIRAGLHDLSANKERLIREVERFETKRENIENEYDTIIAKLFDEYELTLTDAKELRKELENVSKAQHRLSEIKTAMKRMGDVNIGAIEEYKTTKARYDFLAAQRDDLEDAKAKIEAIIAELTNQMKNIFSDQFGVINEKFQSIFKELFGGGSASLTLSDPSDLLGSGIEIHVTPPGKVIKNLSALSGGEQALVAIALYFAIIRVRPTPFCIMDEIETALDEVNTARFARYLHTLTENTQVITVTHRRSTMEEADVLYGVTMQEKGVSKLLTINVGEVYEKLDIH